MHIKRFLEQRITNTFQVDRGERVDLLNLCVLWGGFFLSNCLKLLGIVDRMNNLLEQPQSHILQIFGIGGDISNVLEMLLHIYLDLLHIVLAPPLLVIIS